MISRRRFLMVTTAAAGAGLLPMRLYGLSDSGIPIWEFTNDLYWLDGVGRLWRMDGLTSAVNAAWEAA